MAHLLNPKYYGIKWLSEGEGIGRSPLDLKIFRHKLICLNKVFKYVKQNEWAHNEFVSFFKGDEDISSVIDKDNDLFISWGSNINILILFFSILH